LVLERDAGETRLPTPLLLARIATLSGQRDTGDIGLLLLGADGRRLGGNIAPRFALPMGRSDLRQRDGIIGLS
ncbi:hypothetical protein ACP3WZ_26850, partial [Salmonella enterica]